MVDIESVANHSVVLWVVVPAMPVAMDLLGLVSTIG